MPALGYLHESGSVMDFRDIESVLAIAKCGNWGDAANSTFQSMSSLSKRVKKVETDVGATLFERKPHSGQDILTAAGAEALPLIERVELLNRDILRYAHEANSEKTLKLTVGYPPLICSLGEANMMARFKHDWPNVDIYHVLRQKSDLVDMVVNGEIDCAFVLFVGKSKFNNGVLGELINSNVNVLTMFSHDVLHVGVSDKNPLASRDSVRIQDLKDEVFLFNRVPEHQQRDNASVRTLFSAAMNGEIKYRLVDYIDKLTIVNMVVSGYGVLPCACLPARHIGHVKFLKIENFPIPSRGMLLYRPDSPSFALRQFLKYVPDVPETGD